LPTGALIAVGLVVLVIALYLIFGRKGTVPQLEDEQPPQLKPAKKPTAPAKKAPKKAPAKAKPKVAEPAEKVPPKKAEEPEEVSAEEPVAPSPPPAPVSRRKKDVKGLRKGLKKVRGSGGLFGRLRELFSGKKEIDPAIVDEMEEILLTSDVGMKTTQALLEEIREALDRDELQDTDKVWEALRARASEMLDLSGDGPIRNHGQPTVVVMVGVNGTGKTTTIGKLATKFVEDDKKVLLVAGDTFRAAAVQQLQEWGKRVGCEVFAGEDGADPASVAFDAIKKGTEDGVDLIFIDTAGRLHTKSNLMDELQKVVKTCNKALDGAPHETLLVLDGTTGQNALQQAQEFGEILDLSGIVLTKLDGTAKGGVILAIAEEHELPVRYIGVGERPQDLRDFDAEEFVEAMLGQADDAAQAA
jgi:fused signal recognition particle receptor